VRHEDGRLEELDRSVRFVEIRAPDSDEVGVLVYMDRNGMVHVIKPGDPEAGRYAELFKVKFSRSVDLTRRTR
jgi:hypothetical protein